MSVQRFMLMEPLSVEKHYSQLKNASLLVALEEKEEDLNICRNFTAKYLLVSNLIVVLEEKLGNHQIQQG